MANYKNLLLAAVLLGFSFVTGTSASAQFLYNNGAGALGSPDGVGVFADTGDTGTPPYTMEGNIFTAPLSGTATYIDFAGLYYNGAAPGTPPTTDTFIISLYTITGGAPDTSAPVITSTVSGLTRTVLGAGNTRTVYQFNGILDTPLTLTSGTSYFLGISDTTSPYEDFAVDLTDNPSAASVNYGLNGSTGHFDGFTDTPLAFSLSVPEPDEWALMALGLAGLLAVRKVRSRLS